MGAAVTYQVALACKDISCPSVPLTSTVDQAGKPIAASMVFDMGDYDTSASKTDTRGDRFITTVSDGICNYASAGNGTSTFGNGVRIYKSGSTFEESEVYRITMKVIPSGATTGNASVAYWMAQAPEKSYRTVATTTDTFCDALPAAGNAITSWTNAWDYVPNTNSTQIQAQYTISSTDISTYQMGGFLFDLPPIKIGSSATVGQTINVKVDFELMPCGEVATKTICAANLIASCAADPSSVNIDGVAFIFDKDLAKLLHGYLGRLPATSTCHKMGSTLTFPYVPSLAGDYWTGIVLNNMGASAINLTLTVHDSAGGTATTTTSLNGGQQYSTVVNVIKDSLTNGATPLNQSLDNYITVTAVNQ
jgi:hypothetical protein